MKIVLIHAYSSSNSGDGLLVAEALKLLQTKFAAAEVLVLALDPDSFQTTASVRYQHPLTGETSTPSTRKLLLASLSGLARGSRLPTPTRDAIRSADLVVGVGGGYMRGANLIEAVKMVLVHAPQAEAATLNPSTVYLPQSVGPFRFQSARFVLSRLSRVPIYYVRDARSLASLSTAPDVRRVPDNALLAIGDGELPVRPASATPHVGLVARSLASTRQRRARYITRVRDVREKTNAELLLQARARGNDDGSFYEATFGETGSRTLLEGTSGARPASVVISVRLHGAIQSIRNGVPAIHLSYERKGWGAFEDLGLGEYVHNAFDFDSGLVSEQAMSLSETPDAYWCRVTNAVPHLRQAQARISDSLADLAASVGIPR